MFVNEMGQIRNESALNEESEWLLRTITMMIDDDQYVHILASTSAYNYI